MHGPTWTRDELILGLDCYLQNGAKEMTANSQCIHDLSAYLRRLPIHPVTSMTQTFRNPVGVALTLSGFIALDEHSGSRGIQHTSRILVDVWKQYADLKDYIHAISHTIRTIIEKRIWFKVINDRESQEFPEGILLYSLHSGYEKQQRKKNSLESQCSMCGIEPKIIYGDYDILSLHHDVPVSQYSSSKMVNPQDFILLCPNCHMVVHRMTPKTYMKTKM